MKTTSQGGPCPLSPRRERRGGTVSRLDECSTTHDAYALGLRIGQADAVRQDEQPDFRRRGTPSCRWAVPESHAHAWRRGYVTGLGGPILSPEDIEAIAARLDDGTAAAEEWARVAGRRRV